MSRPRIIGIHAPAPQSGKSTTAKILHEKFGYQIFPFADTLKMMVRPILTALGYSPDEIIRMERGDKRDIIRGINIELRFLYQTIGTDWGREIVHKDMWTIVWEEKVSRILSDPTLDISIVADDVRFPNEIEAIYRLGGEMWDITRPGTVKGTNHSSEHSISASVMFDVRLVNDGTVDDLEQKIGQALR